MSARLGDGQHLMVEAGVIDCLECKWWCRTGYPCRCCLAAEVERLTAALAKREADYMGLWEHSQEYMVRSRDAEAEVKRLTAELADRDQCIEAVLHVLDTSQTDNAADLEHAIRAALRGDS